MSVHYYIQNFESFIEGTLNVDMQPLYRPFLTQLKIGAHILDVGCGSGRDSLAFKALGYKVSAFDACVPLAKAATKIIGQNVTVAKFSEFQIDPPVDGIWACASLLHVPSIELPNTFNHLANQLIEGGVFYCSFKLGNDDVNRGGRHFTNATEERLNNFIVNTPLKIQRTWTSADCRPGRANESWLNAIMIKTYE